MEEKWDMVITPCKNLFDIDIKGIWRYRDLYRMYVKRDIVTVYKQTILGPLWFFIQPVFTTIMYIVVFGGLAGISTDGVPQPVFYMSGILFWNYFNACFTASSTVFMTNAAVFGKVYFPRLVVPLSGLTSNLVKFAIQFVLWLGVYLYYVFTGVQMSVNWTIILFPLLIAMTALFAMSWGLIVTSLTTKYRDLNMLVTFGIQLFMYATPIIYPLSAAPEKYRWLLQLNPLSSIFEFFRYSVTGAGVVDWSMLLYSAVCLVISLFIGLVLFSKTERNFMDTI